jgi:hypothetical protein
MSTIRVDNFGPSAGGTTYSAQGIAKAWADMTATATLNASLNVSSGVDNGAGDYTTNLTSAFSSSDYAIASNMALSFLGNTMSNNVNASSYRNYGFYVNFPGSNTPAADTVIHTVAFGDLA